MAGSFGAQSTADGVLAGIDLRGTRAFVTGFSSGFGVETAGVVADADAVGGRYCEDCGVAATSTDAAIRRGVLPYAADGERARSLWAKSEEMVAERF